MVLKAHKNECVKTIRAKKNHGQQVAQAPRANRLL
jgi:hypothetical protein